MIQHSTWCRFKFSKRWWEGFNNSHIQEMWVLTFSLQCVLKPILLGYDSMSLGNWLLTLQRNAMPSQHQERMMQSLFYQKQVLMYPYRKAMMHKASKRQK